MREISVFRYIHVCRRTDQNSAQFKSELGQFKTVLGQVKILAVGRIRGEIEGEREDVWNGFIYSPNH